MVSYHWEFAILGKLETKEKIDIIVKQRKSGMWKWNKEKEGWDSKTKEKKGWYIETKEKRGWADMKFTITSGIGRHLSLVVAAAHSWAGIIPTNFDWSSSLQGALSWQKNVHQWFWRRRRHCCSRCINDSEEETVVLDAGCYWFWRRRRVLSVFCSFCFRRSSSSVLGDNLINKATMKLNVYLFVTSRFLRWPTFRDPD